MACGYYGSNDDDTLVDVFSGAMATYMKYPKGSLVHKVSTVPNILK